MPTEKNNPSIDFKPLTSGLGFHPFSDGLPYAPISKSAPKTSIAARPDIARTPNKPDLSSGTGAVSAGPARLAKSAPSISPGLTPTSPRVSVPVANPIQPRNPRAQATPLQQAQAQAQTAAATPQQARFAEPTFGFVYVMKRVLAYTVDTALNVALCATGLSFALVNQDMKPELLFNAGMILVSALFMILFNWALVTAQEIAFGTSVGKRIFGLSLQGSTSALFLRAFFFLPSLGFCGIGLLWCLFDKQRRCWHDLVVNVQPTEVAKL